MRLRALLRRGWPLAGALAVALLVTAAPAPATGAPMDGGTDGSGVPETPAGGPTSDDPAVSPGVYVVTLPTGDVVTVRQHPDGRQQLDVEPADRGGAGVDFEQTVHGEDLYLIPVDASPLIPGQLDPELFNVTKLVRHGYHAEGTGDLPVIVTRPAGDVAGALASGPDARTLTSIDATATAFDADSATRFWRQAAGAASAESADLAGVGKVWLDEPARVLLEDSVPLVGAPQAWDDGFDGAGSTVAVLDTGVDESHPDLQVAAAKNFIDAGDAGDGHGHGTHVASTVAGSGAASDGARAGVAPGAQLLSGKVCDASGDCLQSAMIAGMEWAAQQGADVTNISIGGTVTDGSDPLSQAVDSLTDEYGTLFVVSAGNDGSGEQTVTTPGTADAALTVGAVDKDEELAGFSSRGPRAGDYAVKPDITAPGVDIGAARADGTSLGDPIDDDYTSEDGTSMAAPHVAGAAAILRQQDPQLGPAEAKALLAGTAVAHDELDVYQQGGGRLDVPRALAAPLVATPAPVDLGYFEYPHEDADPVSVEVSYRNRTDQELVADLSLQVTDQEGDPPAEEMLQVQPSQLTVPPGESATATVTVDVSVGELGRYGGYLTAGVDGDPALATPVGFFKEAERYDLSVVGIDTEGDPSAESSFTVLDVTDHDQLLESFELDSDGTATLRVPSGTYALQGMLRTTPPDENTPNVWTAMAEPEVEITEDTELVFDARAGNPVTVETPAHDAEPRRRTALQLSRGTRDGFRANRSVLAYADGTTFQAAPSEAVTLGAFEFSSRWQLADPEEPIDTSFLYDVIFPEEGAIPEDLHYVVRPEDVGTSVQNFHVHVDDHPQIREYRHAWRPWQRFSTAFLQDTPVGAVRTDYLTAADTQWTRDTVLSPQGYSTYAARMSAPRMQYQPGEHEVRDWYQQVVTPGMIEGSPWHEGGRQYREGDTLQVSIAEFVDNQRGHWSWYHSSLDEAAFRVFEDGDPVAEQERPQGSFGLSPDPSRVRMELDVNRDGVDWWQLSTRTETAWEFDTTRPEAGDELVPFLLVDYDTELDLTNTAAHPRQQRGPATLELRVRHQPGITDPPAIDGADVAVSLDDGDTWLDRPLREPADGVFEVVLPQRDPADGTGYVSLRVQAWDAEGNRIEQEVTRAWRLAPR